MRPRAPITLALAGLTFLAVAGACSPTSALYVAPALLVLAVLVADVFPGERTLVRLRSRRRRARPVRGPGRAPRPVLAHVARRAGRSLAFALAMRPPPAVAVLR